MESGFDHDFVVIGSGFGGSVSALRLAEKGYRVAVLEMGRRWRAGDFARTNWNVRKYLWRPRLGLHGIQQITLLRGLLVFHGAGVGGGSLVYANTLLTPPDRVFRDPRWPADPDGSAGGSGPGDAPGADAGARPGSSAGASRPSNTAGASRPGSTDWKERLAPHYATARAMLGATPAPRTFPADELLRQVVEEETGRGATFSRNTVGVWFGEPNETVPDPFFGGEGPERTGCIHCGECMTGCRHGAKNTLDRNYLHLAERRGAEIHPETLVEDLRPLPGGGFELQVARSTALLRRRRRAIRARRVVVSAGTLGTVALLLGCKARGSLPALSAQLGNYVRTNSEALLGARARTTEVEYSEGIAITSGVHPDDDTHVEIVRYGKGQDFMALLTTVLTGGGPPWPRWLRWLGNVARHPYRTALTYWPFGWARRTAIVLVMQPVDSFMRLVLRRRPWGEALAADVRQGPRPATYIPLANRLTARLAEKMGGTAHSLLPEVLLDTSSTAHILGGAPMGRTPEEGVCDARGRVFGYEGLYVADGSLVPANLGVNPSLTITALAEHVMAGIPACERGPGRPAPVPAPATTPTK